MPGQSAALDYPAAASGDAHRMGRMQFGRSRPAQGGIADLRADAEIQLGRQGLAFWVRIFY
jgi:hypothetical protein